nr:MAG TPA: hypothetical protein [Caudoviricetes sp.]
MKFNSQKGEITFEKNLTFYTFILFELFKYLQLGK